jgi:tape measure domain-containing protein
MSGIRVELQLDDGTFTTRMLHAGETVNQFNQNLGQTATAFSQLDPYHRSFIGRLRDVVVTIAATRLAFDGIRSATTGWAADIVQVNAEFERLTVLLRGMSKAPDPTKEAQQQVKELREFAKDAPFALKGLTDTFVKLKSAGIDPMAGSLRALTDSVAAFGGNEEALHRVTIAIQQMSGKGVIQMEELRQQLGEHIPRAVELMARSVGVSTGQLIQIISKGTLDAKSTLEAFQMELDRTFGGAAHAQMQTFNGQLSQMRTNFQNLAIVVGETGFFTTVKAQLKDFNSFLSSNAADVLAKDLGSALNSIVNGFRGALEWVVEFRDGLLRLGTVLAAGFGVNLALSFLASLGQGMRNMITATTALRLEMQALNVAMQFNSLGVAVGNLGIAGMGISKTTALVRGLGVALAGLSAVASFAGSVLLPLTAVVLGIAWAFGFFENKVKDAYDAVIKYGAADEKQLELAEQYVQVLKERAEWLKRVADEQRRGASIGAIGAGEFAMPENQADLDTSAIQAASEAQSAADKALKARQAFEKRRIQEAVRAELEFVGELTSVRQKARDDEEIRLGQEYQNKLKALQDTHRDTTALTQEYQVAKRARDLEFYQNEFNDYSNSLEATRTNLSYSLQTREALEAAFLAKMKELQDRRTRLMEMPTTPQTLNKGNDVQKAIDKATGMLVKLNAEIENHRATLKGADGELAQFIATLEDPTNKSFFPKENADLQLLIQRLKEAKALSEGLKDEVAGQTELSNDIANAVRRAREDEEKANRPKNYDTLTETDKILAKINSPGGYSGLKPLAQMMVSVGTGAKDAATSMNAAFGDDITTKGRTLESVIASLTTAWGLFSTAVNGTKLPDKLPSAAEVVGGYSTPDNSALGTMTPEQRRRFEQARETEQRAKVAQFSKNAQVESADLTAQINAALESIDGLDKRVRAFKREVASGKFGADFVGTDQWADMLHKAEQLDAIDRSRADRAKLTNKIEGYGNNKDNEIQALEDREDELQRRLENESRYRQPRELNRKNSALDREEKATREARQLGILDPSEANDRLAGVAAMRERWSNVIVGEEIQKEQAKNQEIKKSLMTVDEARQYGFDLEVKRLNDMLSLSTMNADQRALLEKTLTDKITLYRKKMVADSPIGKEMRAWSDVTNNLQTATVSWMNGFTDNLAKMVATGKADFKSLADSIITDLIRMTIRATIAKTILPMFGLGGGGGGAMDVNNGFVPFVNGGGIVATKHTGGVVGGFGGSSKWMSHAAFMNAPRFHTGGFPGLTASEVPIVAKKGEIIGWPDQLAKAFGGGGGVAQTNNLAITVNGSSGTPEQNDDLTRKIATAMSNRMEQMVTSGIAKQMRNGGLLKQY